MHQVSEEESLSLDSISDRSSEGDDRKSQEEEEEEEEISYQRLIKDFPVGLVVYQLMDPEDNTSLTFRYRNEFAEIFRLLFVNEQIILFQIT